MATGTEENEKELDDRDLAIITPEDGNMEPVAHDHLDSLYFGWKHPKQSFFCCAFYSILCIAVALIMVFTNSPTYDQEYNNPAEYYVTETNVIYVKEWQFLAKYIEDMNRMVPGFGIWCLSIGVPLIGSFATLTFFGTRHSKYQTKEWIWDDIISLLKGYTIIFFLCYGMASFVSARISLPKPSGYEICDYNLSDKECEKTDSNTLEKAWTSFPNADISFLVGSLFYFTLYSTNKIQMILNPIFRKKFENSLARNEVILNNYNNNNNNNENSQQESQSRESSKNGQSGNGGSSVTATMTTSAPGVGVTVSNAPTGSESILSDNNNNNNNNNSNSNDNKNETNNIDNNNDNNNTNNNNINNNNSNNNNDSNNSNNNINRNRNNNENDENKIDFGEHRLLSLYFIGLICGFWPTYIGIFVSITIVHDDIAYVWDLLGSCVIAFIMTWFTYRMFWDSPFDCMELGFTFELSGIPRNSFFYDKKVRFIRKNSKIYNNVARIDLGLQENNNQGTNRRNKNNNNNNNNGNVRGGGNQANTPVTKNEVNDNDALNSVNSSNSDESTQPLNK